MQPVERFSVILLRVRFFSHVIRLREHRNEYVLFNKFQTRLIKER